MTNKLFNLKYPEGRSEDEIIAEMKKDLIDPHNFLSSDPIHRQIQIELKMLGNELKWKEEFKANDKS